MPGMAEKICAMPTASDTAPPGLPTTRSSTASVNWRMFEGVWLICPTAATNLGAGWSAVARNLS